jgi:hypothetical protein
MHGRPFRRYGALAAGLVLALLAIVGGINGVVDPYGVWQVARVRGFNQAKSERRDYILLFKAVDVARLRPATIFLGSSRTAFGLDPHHRSFADQGTTYNLALYGGQPRLMRRYFEHALFNNPKLETVILGADFFVLSTKLEPPEGYSEARLDRTSIDWPDTINTLFSIDAFGASVRTVLSNLRDPDFEPVEPLGSLTAMDLRREAESEGMIRRFNSSLHRYLNDETRFAGFEFSEEAFADFAAIVAACRARDIRLIVFVSPVHATLLEAIRQRGLWPSYLRWKQRLAEVTPFWDFSGFNRITTEPIEFEMRSYWDASHYRKTVGDQILNRIFHIDVARVPADFGAYVTVHTVDAHLAHLDRAARQWESANPTAVDFVAKRLRDRRPERTTTAHVE